MKYTILSALVFVIVSSGNLSAQVDEQALKISLADAGQLTIEGSHRFLEISGIKGLHVRSLETKAFVDTNMLDGDKGTFSIWMSPLEDMNKSPNAGKLENGMTYAIASDHWPLRMTDESRFSIYYQGAGYPRLIGRFTDGSFWGQMDFGMAPFVYAEELPLRKGQWYHIVVTWDKPSEKLTMYINGQHVGHNNLAKAFKTANRQLFIGNPLMVVSNLIIVPRPWSEDEIKTEYHRLRPSSNAPSDNTIKTVSSVKAMKASPLVRDGSWEKVYACSFTNPSEFNDWTFQTGDLYRDKFKLNITKDGLYWETPDIIHNESRGFLWSPVNVEGDQWIAFDFQVISPRGLALVMWCASGMQGEDVIGDHGLTQSGSMGSMLSRYRNYHWEFVRRVEAMRTDVETQYVNKNPWSKSLYVGCVPRFEPNKWYRLSCIKVGNRLIGLLDGKVVFDVEDDPYDNNGPLLNSGRIVLRQMYHTAMRYRNFVVYRKKE